MNSHGSPPEQEGANGDKDVGDSATRTSNKRRRIAIACSACRTRKSRCDGVRPKCGLCTELGFDCVYVQSSSSNNVIVGKDYLSAIEQRVENVEETLHSLQRQITGLSTHGLGKSTAPASLGPSSASGTGLLEVQDVVETNDSVDAMGALVFANEEETGFFGPSSNIAFLRHVSGAVTHATDTKHPWSPLTVSESRHLTGGFMSASRPPSPIATRQGKDEGPDAQVNLYALPHDSEVMDLIRRYFNNTGYLFPFIHEETFLRTYMDFRGQPQPKVRRTWLGLLNMVLAIATNAKADSDLDAARRSEESYIYYQRALGLCQKQIMRGTSLEVVQYLLLMGLYLQGTQKSVEAWAVHGLAVKAAFQLGLHSSEASKSFTPVDREIRKRTWFCCVVLDRTLSMTFGRPAAIPDRYVKLDMPVETEVDPLSPPSVEGSNPTNISFFAATIRLYKILFHVIDCLYGQNIGCDKPLEVGEIVAPLFNGEHQLMDWERTLPANLKLTSSQQIISQNLEPSLQEDDCIELKLRTILTLRYLNLCLLLHRPILTKFLDLGSSNNYSHELRLLQQVGSNSIKVCIQSSIEVIAIVHAAVQNSDGNRSLGAWWFSLYYTFNAALVIFGCLFLSQSTNSTLPPGLIPNDAAKTALGKAIDALNLLDGNNHLVERCRHYLQQLVYVLHSSMPRPQNVEMAAENQLYADPQPQFDLTNFDIAADPSWPMQSAFDINLGEFILDSDMQFLNNYFRKDGLGVGAPAPAP